MKIRRTVSMGDNASTLVGQYVHAAFEKAPECGTLGVLVEVKAGKDSSEIKDLLKELSMQVAAASPKWIKREDVPSDIVKKETDIYKEQCRQSGKPEKAWDKIIENKTADFYKQFCLLEQSYVRDPKTTVQAYIQSVVSKIGDSLSVTNISRFKVGEEA